MAVRFTSKGPQSYAPSSPFGGGTTTIRRGGGGGGAVSTPEPNVSISGTTVFIDGQGYSVPYSSQASFIQQKTGGVGSSAQQAIQRATSLPKRTISPPKPTRRRK